MADKDTATGDHSAHLRALLAEKMMPDGKPMRQAQLAANLGLSQSQMNAVLNGHAPLQAKAAGLAARLFECRARQLTRDPAAYFETNIAIIFEATDEDWQRLYQRALVRRLNNSIFTFHPLYAQQDFDWEEFRGNLDTVLHDKACYAACIVVIPVCTDEQFLEVVQFAARFEKPVIAVDRNALRDKTRWPMNLSCVSFDDEVGGRSAGEEVRRLISEKGTQEKKDNVAFVVTGPREELRAAKVARGEGFRRELKVDGTDVRILPSDFTRDAAADVASEFLKKALEKNKQCVAALGTSGVMTAGIVKAVSETYDKEGREGAPLVAGYDITDETEKLLKSGDIIGTVDQNVEQLAHKTITQLELLWCGKPVERDVPLKPHFRLAQL